MSNPVILYILECKHIIPGTIGQAYAECLNCKPNAIRKIIDVHTWEWRVVCQTCNYRVWCGLSRKLAEYHANGHVRKRTRHDAQVRYVENPYGVKMKEKMLT